MERLIAEVDGKLVDLTNVDSATAAPYLARAASVTVAHPDIAETVINYPTAGRWRKGGQDANETDLPDGWDFPGGKRLQRPGGKENPQKAASNGKPEVKAKWRIQSSNPSTSPSIPKKTGRP